MNIQVHIAGTKRSGKTTLARKILAELERRHHHAVLFDIDEVRRTLFGDVDKNAAIGSPENQKMHREAHEWIFNTGIPSAFREEKIPIMVATHSHRALYERAETVARQQGTILKFLILETLPLEEIARRAKADEMSLSDTRNLESDAAQMREYLISAQRFEESYRDKPGNYLWIAQDTPEKMLAAALQYIFR